MARGRSPGVEAVHSLPGRRQPRMELVRLAETRRGLGEQGVAEADPPGDTSSSTPARRAGWSSAVRSPLERSVAAAISPVGVSDPAMAAIANTSRVTSSNRSNDPDRSSPTTPLPSGERMSS